MDLFLEVPAATARAAVVHHEDHVALLREIIEPEPANAGPDVRHHLRARPSIGEDQRRIASRRIEGRGPEDASVQLRPIRRVEAQKLPVTQSEPCQIRNGFAYEIDRFSRVGRANTKAGRLIQLRVGMQKSLTILREESAAPAWSFTDDRPSLAAL